MKKRLLGIFLATAILFGSVPVALASGTGENLRPGSVGSLETDGAKIEKYAQPTGADNEYLITLEAYGKEISVGSGADIVLVIDTSGSMSNSLAAMKTAAHSFIDQLLTEKSANRIGLVSFASNGSIRHSLTEYTAAAVGSSKANKSLKDAVDALRSDGGTHTQAGIHLANSMLADSTAANKYIILLSDGEPTYCYTPRFDNATVHCESGRFGGCKNTDFEAGSITGYDYDSRSGSGSSSAFNVRVSAECNRGREHSESVRASCADAAIYEAGLGKAAGYTYYTIGYGLSDDNSARNVLKNIASLDDNNEPRYYNASTSNIQTILKDIGVNIIDSIKDSSVTDPMGAMVDLVFSGARPLQSSDPTLADGGYYVSQGTVAYDAATETFQWQPGLIKEGTPAVLKYKIRVDVEAPGFRMDTAYPANGTTTFTYTKPAADGGQENRELEFKVPQVVGTFGTYFTRGYLVNEQGQPINADGEVVASPAQAAVVYGETAVINPRNNANQWAYGSKALEAQSVTGYVLYGASSRTVSITAQQPSATAWFPFVRKSTAFTVEHYFEDLSGSFKLSSGDTTSDVIYFGESKAAADFVLTRSDYTYDPGNPAAVSSITYGEGSTADSLTLKLYYIRKTADLTVRYVFEGGPKAGTETLTPSPVVKHGQTVSADDYKLDTASGAYANYRFTGAQYSGLGAGNTVTGKGGVVVLTYRYAEVNARVVHKYPGLADVQGRSEDFFLNTVLDTGAFAVPVTYYNGKLYTVTATAVTVGGAAVQPEQGKVTLSGDAVITITYALADAGFRVEHYFQNLAGEYVLDANIGSGTIQFGETKNAADYVRSVTGFTYQPDHADAINTISFLSGSQPTGTVLKLYYSRNRTTFTIEHYYQNLDGSYNTSADDTVAGGAFQFGETKRAADFLKNKTGFTYDPLVAGSITAISYDTEPVAGTVLKLYYSRNQTTFTVEHYYQNLDGSYNTAADNTVDGGVFQFGETKYASDFRLDRTGFTYDAAADGSVTSISYNTEPVAGTVLKLYYARRQTTFTIEHYYQKPDGSYNTAADDTVAGGVFQFGETKNATDFVKNKTGFTYAPNHEDAVSSIAFTGDQPTGTVLKLYYTRNQTAFTVEHYYEQVDGSFVKQAPTAQDGGVFRFGETKRAADYIRTVTDRYYDAAVAGSITTITYDTEPAAGTVLKLYYLLVKTDLTVQYHFVGGPKNNTVDTLTPSPNLRVGTTVDANHYLLDPADIPHYSYVDAVYTGLGAGNTLTSTPGGKVVLTYRYDEVTVNVIHRYPDLADVPGGITTHFLHDTVNANVLGAPVTIYNDKLYTVVSTAVSTQAGAVTPAENGDFQLTADTTIVITYALADANFTVVHYFEDEDGNYLPDSNVDSGVIKSGETKNAADFVRSVTGFTYEPEHEGAISSISYPAAGLTGDTLTLYYSRNKTTFTVEHYYQKEDGSYNTVADDTVAGGVFQFGETKNAADFLKNQTGFTYDASVEGSVTAIRYDTEPAAGTVLKLYYTRNQADFTVEHYYQKEDGSYNEAADDTVVGGKFQFGETKNAADFLKNKTGFTYAPNHENAVSSIAFTGDQPTGTVLKLYYTRNQADFTVEHYFEQPDGSFLKSDDVDSGEIVFGQTVQAQEYVRTVADYSYDAGHEGEVASITYDAEPMSSAVLKLYYVLGRYNLTINYVYENGDEAADSYTDVLPVGSSYDVASPVIQGYEADIETVEGTMPNRDVTVTVTYAAGEDIHDPDLPIVNPPVSKPNDPGEDISDPDTPIADNPKTGGKMPFVALAAATASFGGVLLLKKKKEDGEDDNA